MNAAIVTQTLHPTVGALEAELVATLPHMRGPVKVLSGPLPSDQRPSHQTRRGNVVIDRHQALSPARERLVPLDAALDEQSIGNYIKVLKDRFGNWPDIFDARHLSEVDNNLAAAVVRYAAQLGVPAIHSQYYQSMRNPQFWDLGWTAHVVRDRLELESLFMVDAPRDVKIVETPYGVDLSRCHPNLGHLWQPPSLPRRYVEVFLATPFEDPDYGMLGLEIAKELQGRNIPARVSYVSPARTTWAELGEARVWQLHAMARHLGVPIAQRLPAHEDFPYALARADVVVPRDVTDGTTHMAVAVGIPVIDAGSPEGRRSIPKIADDIELVLEPGVRKGMVDDRLAVVAQQDAPDAARRLCAVYDEVRSGTPAPSRGRAVEPPALLRELIDNHEVWKRELLRELPTAGSAPRQHGRLPRFDVVVATQGPDTRLEYPMKVMGELDSATAHPTSMLVMCSNRRSMQTMASSFLDPRMAFFDVEPFLRHRLNLPKTNAHPYALHGNDTPAKQNLALILAKMRGVETIVMIDDDIIDVSIDDLLTAIENVGPGPDQFDVIWVPVTDDADHATVIDIAERWGLPAAVVGGFGVAVARVGALLAMPPMSGHDWTSAMRSIENRRVGYIGEGRQLRTWRFLQSDRTRFKDVRPENEEVGEIILTGHAFNALLEERGIAGAGVWSTFTPERLAGVQSNHLFAEFQLDTWIRGRPNFHPGVVFALGALEVARQRNLTLDPVGLCGLVETFVPEAAEWERETNQLPRVGTFEEATIALGLGGACVSAVPPRYGTPLPPRRSVTRSGAGLQLDCLSDASLRFTRYSDEEEAYWKATVSELTGLFGDDHSSQHPARKRLAERMFAVSKQRGCSDHFFTVPTHRILENEETLVRAHDIVPSIAFATDAVGADYLAESRDTIDTCGGGAAEQLRQAAMLTSLRSRAKELGHRRVRMALEHGASVDILESVSRLLLEPLDGVPSLGSAISAANTLGYELQRVVGSIYAPEAHGFHQPAYLLAPSVQEATGHATRALELVLTPSPTDPALARWQQEHREEVVRAVAGRDFQTIATVANQLHPPTPDCLTASPGL